MVQSLDDVDGAIQLGVDSILEHFAELGLNLSIERDFDDLRRFLESQGAFANPTFDPRAVDLGTEDFWLLLRSPEDNSVACSAERIFADSDFDELLQSGKLWRRDGFGEVEGLKVKTFGFSENVSHSGSTFVAPEWRGRGLSMMLTFLSRGLGFRNSGIARNTGVVREHLKYSPVPRQSYGYPHVELCWDGFFPPLGNPEKLYLCWINRQEFASSCLEMPDHERYPVPLKAISEGRQASDTQAGLGEMQTTS